MPAPRTEPEARERSAAGSPGAYVQRDQPAGVPPLELTGERTLPDVPAENYWFRRHLAVYEWIARRVAGARVIDMACGEGYGVQVLARSAAAVTGVDANPQAHEHARLRYAAANVKFERALVESYAEPADAVVFLQTIEHLQDPGAVLAHFRSLVGPDGTVYVSTPNVRTLAPKGAESLGQPLARARVPAGGVRAAVPGELLARSSSTGCSTPASCGSMNWHCAAAGTACTRPSESPSASTRASPRRSARATSRLRGAGEADLERALDFLAVCRA